MCNLALTNLSNKTQQPMRKKFVLVIYQTVTKMQLMRRRYALQSCRRTFTIAKKRSYNSVGLETNIREWIPSGRLFAQRFHGSKRYFAMLSLTGQRFSVFIVNKPLDISVFKVCIHFQRSSPYIYLRFDQQTCIKHYVT